MRGVLPAFLKNLPAFPRLQGETGSIWAPSTTTHSRFLPTCGDAPKMPTNGGLFQCVLRVSRSAEGTRPISDLSLCGKKSRSWRRKGVVTRAPPRSCRCWMRTASEIRKCEEVESGLDQTEPLKLQ